jgi:hypothetical protein
MAIRIEIPALIHSRNNRDLPATQGSITRVTWDKPEQTKNALRTLGMWLGACFCSVFVPFAHWILVPSLFITAFVMAMDKLGEHMRSEGGSGECPKCHQSFVIEKGKWNTRLTDTCGNCHEDLEINLQIAD